MRSLQAISVGKALGCGIKRVKQKVLSSLTSIKRTQFPLGLAWVSTGDKGQGFSLDQGVVGFGSKK